MAQDADGESTGESEGMDTDEEHLAPPGEEEEEVDTPLEGEKKKFSGFLHDIVFCTILKQSSCVPFLMLMD